MKEDWLSPEQAMRFIFGSVEVPPRHYRYQIVTEDGCLFHVLREDWTPNFLGEKK